MSVTVCLNTQKVNYLSPLLNKYCKLLKVVCVTYAINYGEYNEEYGAVIKSNLTPLTVDNLSFNAGKCLAQQNFKLLSQELKQMVDSVDKQMSAVEDNYRSCTRWIGLKTAAEKAISLFIPLYNVADTFVETIKTKCPYGEEQQYLIGITADEMAQIPISLYE